MKKEDAVLVVSFGTSYNDSRKKTIEAIEKTIAGHFHDYEFHRAFTSRVIIQILEKRDSIAVDGVSEAMERLFNQGIDVYKRQCIWRQCFTGGTEGRKPADGGRSKILSELQRYCLLQRKRPCLSLIHI